MVMPRGFSSSIMHPAIKSDPEMCFLLAIWWSICWSLCFKSICTDLIFNLSDLRAKWVHNKDGPCMRAGINLLTGVPQPFYFPYDHPTITRQFKEMEQIICKCGLWPENGLPAECPGFNCPEGQVSCCCRCVLFNQADFVSQKSQLQELIELCWHICDFWPEYHCELNFIELYWGAAKLCFRISGCASTINQFEKLIIKCLDDVPLIQIRQCIYLSLHHGKVLTMTLKYANCSSQSMHAYHEGLTGA